MKHTLKKKKTKRTEVTNDDLWKRAKKYNTTHMQSWTFRCCSWVCIFFCLSVSVYRQQRQNTKKELCINSLECFEANDRLAIYMNDKNIWN